jgi:hypothetical protein
MPKKATGALQSGVQNKRNTPVVPTVPDSSNEGGHAQTETSPKGSRQHSVALNHGAAVENIRRANLHVLTARSGSKVRLAAVMGLTGSNMAHRLHGKKRMDDAEANRFTERLGLPTGWLNTPRSEAEIPESVSHLLLPASRGKSSQEQGPGAAAAEKRAEAEAEIGNVRSARAPASTPADQNSHIPAGSAIKEAIVISQQDHASDLPAELASPSFRENDASLPGTLEQMPVVAVPQPHLMPGPFTSVTSLENLEGIEPIAEALLKTLANKARTGRLDELKALELLQQAVLL